jgi:hypothetical protein
MRPFLLAAAPLALVIGCAAPQVPSGPSDAASPERQCFSPSQVRNFRTTRDQTVYLRVGNAAVYRLDAVGDCSDAERAVQIAVVPERGGSRLCTGDWATLAAPGSAAPVQTCRVRIEKALTAEEVAALPEQDRP